MFIFYYQKNIPRMVPFALEGCSVQACGDNTIKAMNHTDLSNGGISQKMRYGRT